jgi:hypothetical protein
MGLTDLLTFHGWCTTLPLGALGHGLTLLAGNAATEGLEGLFYM